jgi:hypothetical protein
MPDIQAPPKETAMRMSVMPGYSVLLEPRFFKSFGLALGIYAVAAIMTNEWMYLLSASFITIIILGFFIPFIEVFDIDAEASMPEGLLASQTAELKIRLRKKFIFGPLSALIPLRCLRIRINVVRRSVPGQPEEYVFPPEPLLVDGITDEVWLSFPSPNLRRGVYRLDSIELMSCYPFGLAWWKRTIESKQDIHGRPLTITIRPKGVEVKGDFLNALEGTSSNMGFSSSESTSVVQSTSVRGVREFRMGDSIRHIHWPSTARLGKLLVREFDSESLPVYDLLLDLRANWKNREQFELAVCTFFSLVHHGYTQGHVPEIFFNPPLDSKVIQKNLMFDLPQLPPGMELVTEILARVEPMNMVDLVRDMDEKSPDDEGRVLHSRKEVLAPIPAQDSIMKFLPGKGDSVLYPVELIIVPEGWDEDFGSDNEAYQKDQAQMKTSRPKSARVKVVQKSEYTKVVGTIDSEADLALL